MRGRRQLVASFLALAMPVVSCGGRTDLSVDSVVESMPAEGAVSLGSGRDAAMDGLLVASHDAAPRCGDGHLDGGEICDDGNNVSGDGCSSDCRSTEVCGNSIVDVKVGEQCEIDEGNPGATCSYRCRRERAEWLQLFPVTSPRAQSEHSMVYDAARSRLVLLGYDFQSEFDGQTWHNVSPIPAPSARVGSAMAYDDVRARSVLFGGWKATVSADTVFSDTWEYAAGSWTQTTPGHSPHARRFHAMVYDAGRARTVLFGGCSQSTGCKALSDTWEYDGRAWTEVTPGGSPPARAHHAMAYDASRGRVVLFGGWDAPSSLVDTNVHPLGDTWEFDGTRWVAMSPAKSPPATMLHSMTFDPSRNRVVMFGGASGAHDVADTWEYDGRSWFPIATGTFPDAREALALAYDPSAQRVLLWGGRTEQGNWMADTWQYQWHEVPAP